MCKGPGAGPSLVCWRNSEEPVWSRVTQREEWRAARDRAGGAEPCGLLGGRGLFTPERWDPGGPRLEEGWGLTGAQGRPLAAAGRADGEEDCILYKGRCGCCC